jgi:hypothetical protein
VNVKDWLVLVGELAALAASIAPIISKVKKISEGTKCQLRSEMLRTYYHNKDFGKIRQFEYENFVYCYDAYKALKGNSFIDKISDEVKQWEIIT